jgi:predicted DNA-binding transcriptional regulator AlpA
MSDNNEEANGRMLRTPEAARMIGLSPATLQKYRCVGGGPPFIRYGNSRVVVYPASQLTIWAESHGTRGSTSDSPRAA